MTLEGIEKELKDLITYKIQRKRRIPNRLYLCEDLDIIEISIDYYSTKLDELKENKEMSNAPILFELSARLSALSAQREGEIEKVIKKYTEVLKEYYISIEEIGNMLGVNVQYIKICMKQTDLQTLELHRTIRRWIKKQVKLSEKKGQFTHPLIEVIEKYKVDYNKKIFVSKASLYGWLRTHMTTPEGCELTKDMLNEIMAHRYLITTPDGRTYPFLCSLKAYKDYMHMKHDSQLYRVAHKTFCMYNNEANKPMARFCLDPDFTRVVMNYEFNQLKSSS